MAEAPESSATPTGVRLPRSLWKLSRKRIFLGTSGYSYDDWIGPFYLPGTKKPHMLEYYQQFFPTVELNYTYYTMPRPSTLFQISNKAPHMRFSVKAHQSLTHDRRVIRQDWQQFGDALMVLADAGQLAAVLFQFPFSFKCTQENFVYLDEICEYFHALPVVLELRHAGWHHETTYEYARHRQVTVCSIDAPHLPGLSDNIVHADRRLSYYRLHGRNAVDWFNGDNVTRYDYLYTDEEIDEIARSVLALARQSDTVYVYANNHPCAQAIDTIISIARALDRPDALAAL